MGKEGMPEESQDILECARRGNRQAFGALLERHRPYLELLARVEVGRLLQTKVDTSDVIQETFLEAHRGFQEFRGTDEATFRAWLQGILGLRVSLLVRRYLGSQRRDLRRETPLDPMLDRSSQAIDRGLMALQSTPSEKVARAEQGAVLADALARLPSDYREVIVLRHLEELSFQEVADRMERSIDSVQKLWVRALARLRKLMKDAP